jgi:hypothetical protein
MNFWISGAKDTLIKAISRCDALIINEGKSGSSPSSTI